MFKKLISFDEAKQIIDELQLESVGSEVVPLGSASGRVLSSDVESPVDVPPFDRATVDGFTVRAADTYGAEEHDPVVLMLKGAVEIGEQPRCSVGKDETWRIATGAPIPDGADAVVMVENTTEKKSEVQVYRAVVKGENVMKAGSDIKKEQVVFGDRTLLNSRRVGVLAALGFAMIPVLKHPRIGLISTGAEIVKPGERLPPGKIYDINAYTLASAITESGGEAVDFGIVRDDDIEALKKVLQEALTATDVVVTSGGVSVGPKDVVPKILDSLGKPGVIIHGVAVKPGKPLAVAVVQGKPVFALPGNPTSSLLIFHLLVRPVLLWLAGRKSGKLRVTNAKLSRRVFSAKGRRTYVTVSLSKGKDGEWAALPVASGQSGAITTMAMAEGYVELPENAPFTEEGQLMRVVLFEDAERVD
ncbi:MAG: molybdopterin molybdenumtransferase MoeA [Candidatus Bathyarchaeota archaeon]|nr:MAG: molybdopterin molybdenumtransferase MoeA [Candidatus Bathyarchaeota archaeon]